MPTIADARRRLLHPRAAIIPCAATVFAIPVELRISSLCGFAVDEVNTFATDMSLAPRAHAGAKLQQVGTAGPNAYRALGAPIRLFDFDFASDLDAELGEGFRRSRSDLELAVQRDGILTAFVIHFVLRTDPQPRNAYSSGPDNEELVAWDQSVRTLPIECRVAAGMRLKVHAFHTDSLVGIGLPELTPQMIDGSVGHTELFDGRMGKPGAMQPR